jgi:hypothetical protein
MMDEASFAKLCRPSGVNMPYPVVSPVQERIVILALEVAWKELRRDHKGDLATLSEDQTTTLLEARLNVLLDDESVPGFVRESFAVVREPKVTNFNGLHPDKMPDLGFLLGRLRPGLPADYVLYVECKPVNAERGMSPYYGRDGMGCFLEGDYGCKMRSGLMVAYAQEGYTFAEKMEPTLRERFQQPDDPFATTQLITHTTTPESHHARRWCYANQQVPGDIRLLHVWLTTG